MINTALGISPHDIEIARYIDSRMLMIEDFFHERIVAAQADGSIPLKIDPCSTAQVFLGLMISVQVLTRTPSQQNAVHAILTQVEAMLE